MTGIVLVPLGGAVSTVGLLAYASAGTCWVNECRHDDRESQQAAAGVVIVAGAAILAAGVVLLTTTNTTVDFDAPQHEPALPVTSGISLTPRGFVF